MTKFLLENVHWQMKIWLCMETVLIIQHVRQIGQPIIVAIRMAYIINCTQHPEIELECVSMEYSGAVYRCPRCGKDIEIDNLRELRSKCLRLLNIPEFKGAKLIRLDDWYVPEIKEKKKAESGYWIHTDVKTDKDGDTIIVVYVGHKDDNEKAQFFIKPEKGQVTSDHKDLDPSKILSKIEVKFRGKRITQEFDEE